MYSTCIFCNSRLGTNEVVEEFPVGRRVAFDPEKGRLWALCPSCRQWNLSPLETRWEALESLERLYRETPKRYSTEQIGLAKHDEGLEVVRIGRPTRPEYAAWRYGGELLRRRRKSLVLGTLAAGGGAVLVGGLGAGLIAGGAVNVLNLALAGQGIVRQSLGTAARVEGPDGTPLRLRQRHAQFARLTMHEDFEWALSFRYVLDTPEARRNRLRLFLARGLAGAGNPANDPEVTLRGDAAMRAAGKILPVLNRSGASGRRVKEASQFIEEVGSADAAFRRAIDTVPSAWRALSASFTMPQEAMFRLPSAVRLGLEMMAHEDAERRALEGELTRLEAEWREAEEVAAIADNLLLPERVRNLFR